jgi:protein-disulfide isomerase
LSRRGLLGAAISAGLMFAGTAWAAGGEPDGITRAQADSILVELRAIRALLSRPAGTAPTPAPDRRVTLPPMKGQELGRTDAPVTVVEFTDYQCPYCRQFHTQTFDSFKRDWIDTGKVHFITRDLPLDFHANAMAAASAARCAGDQGKFWELRNAMILNSDQLDGPSIDRYARELGVDTTRFGACQHGDSHGVDIRRDLAMAKTAEITGTPTFVIGRTTAGGIDGVVVVGALPYSEFDKRLKQALAAK